MINERQNRPVSAPVGHKDDRANDEARDFDDLEFDLDIVTGVSLKQQMAGTLFAHLTEEEIRGFMRRPPKQGRLSNSARRKASFSRGLRPPRRVISGRSLFEHLPDLESSLRPAFDPTPAGAMNQIPESSIDVTTTSADSFHRLTRAELLLMLTVEGDLLERLLGLRPVSAEPIPAPA